jgi:hypothetical protein
VAERSIRLAFGADDEDAVTVRRSDVGELSVAIEQGPDCILLEASEVPALIAALKEIGPVHPMPRLRVYRRVQPRMPCNS